MPACDDDDQISCLVLLWSQRFPCCPRARSVCLSSHSHSLTLRDCSSCSNQLNTLVSCYCCCLPIDIAILTHSHTHTMTLSRTRSDNFGASFAIGNATQTERSSSRTTRERIKTTTEEQRHKQSTVGTVWKWNDSEQRNERSKDFA